jgi:hypothetical protein
VSSPWFLFKFVKKFSQKNHPHMHMSSYKLCWVYWGQFKAVCDIKIFCLAAKKWKCDEMIFFLWGAFLCTILFINRHSRVDVRESNHLIHYTSSSVMKLRAFVCELRDEIYNRQTRGEATKLLLSRNDVWRKKRAHQMFLQ